MTRRGFVASSVLTAWAVGLGVLFVRELNPSPAARLAEVALRVVPITTYYAVEQNGRHVGFASIAIDTVPRALQIAEYLVTDSSDGGRRSEQFVVRLSRGLSLRDYETMSAVGADTTRITGVVAESALVVTARERVDTVPLSLPAFAGIVGSTVTLLLDDPEVGAIRTLRAIDPLTGRSFDRPTRIEAESLFVVVDSAVADSSGRWFAVHKDTVRAWRFVSTHAPPFDGWIDAQGLVVESHRPDGLTLRRTAFELAFENWRHAHPERAVSARGDGRVVSGTWLASGTTPPTATLDSLRVRLGASISREFTSRFGRAWRAGGSLTFTRLPAARLEPRYSMPTTERWQRVFTRELSPGPSIESDDPAISRRAARLAGDDTNPSAIARRIVAWVHDSLRAEPALASVTASGVMERRSGDAREFALLTTAMARAAGIPAHPVAGLLQHNGRFYQHSWTEVYLGRWIPVDAMLNQFPADASHLPFLTGAVDPGADLERILSRLPLTVVSAIRAP